MRALGIIPARMSSKRFPGKPLAKIAGREMLRRVYDIAAASEAVLLHYVASDSPELFKFCEESRMGYIVTKTDCKSGTERCHDSMRQLSCHPGDIVINIQCDEPTLRPESLDELFYAFEDPSVQIASLCFAPAGKDFIYDKNRVKVMSDDAGDAITFSRRIVSANSWRIFRQHVGVYAYRREVLACLTQLPPSSDLEQMAWLREGYKIRMLEIPYETVAIDVPGDIARAEALLNNRYHS